MKWMKQVFWRRRLWLYAIFFLVLGILAYVSMTSIFLRQETERNPVRAALYAESISNALTRLDHLPYALAADPKVLVAITSGDGTAINPYLSEIAERAQAEVVYLMSASGVTVAASNYKNADSFVGQFYAFRPYFLDAMNGQTGHFFAVGVTTGRPGYFVAEPVRDGNGNIRGAAVVKIGLSALTGAWSGSNDQILVVNEDGIILAASTPAHLFGTIRPLTTAQRQTLADQRQFAEAPLEMIDWSETGNGRASLDGVGYLLNKAPIPREGWTLYYLSSVTGIRLRALLYEAIGLAVVLLAAISVSVFRSAQLDRALSVSNADRQRLTNEIEERRLAEARLNKAQTELARTSRLAALGQLSASITHELGQPISAMRNYLAAEEIEAGSAPGSLNRDLSSLVDRMQNITDQLRFFATPSRRASERIDLAIALRGAEKLLLHDFDQNKIKFTAVLPKEPVCVTGVQIRLEQVLVNLLRNAMQATSGQDLRRVDVMLSQENGQARIAVKDNGPGLGGRTAADLSEPFVTTKSSGEGMGLGLAISAQIIKDQSGTLTAADADDGGAVFVVTLPIVEDTGS